MRRHLARIKNHLLHSTFDWLYGIETMPETGYDPSDWKSFRLMLKKLAPPKPEDVFLDLGCGKGRPLLMAAEAGFQKVIGIELNPRLCAIAEQNASYLQKKQLRSHLTVIQGDVAKISLPEATHYFLFNPFDESTLREFLKKAVAATKNSSKARTLIYRAAVHHQAVLSFPELQPRDNYRSYQFYQILPY